MHSSYVTVFLAFLINNKSGLNLNCISALHLVFLQSKVNSAHYTAQVVNQVLLPFLRQEGDVLLQQDNTRPHMAATLCGGQQEPQITCQLNMYGTWWRKNLLFLQSLTQPLLKCNRCKILGTVYHRMEFGTFMTISTWECITAREGTLHGRLARWRKWKSYNVGEAIEGLENELWCRWSNRRIGEWVVT